MSTHVVGSAPANLRVALLGPPQIRAGDDAIALPRRQTRALLYCLAASPSPVPRARLCLLFWPDIPDVEARRNLTHLLTLLRQALPAPAAVVAGPEEIGLDGARVWSDVRAFSSSLSVADPTRRLTALRQAVDLWRGPFLDGFDSAGSDAFEEWVGQQRAWWGQRYLDTLTRLIDAETASGARFAAIELARRYLVVDDLAEEIHRRLMRLHAAAGDRAAALRQFTECRQALERELGIQPSAATRALRDEIVAGRSPVGTRPRPSVPAGGPERVLSRPPVPVDSLIGREEILADAVRAVSHQETHLLTLTGPGGVGKTRLALTAAAAAEPVFTDGVVFVALAPMRDSALVPAAIAQALGLREAPGRPLVDVLAQALSGRRLLLVLDNFEHLLPAAPIVSRLLASAPRLTVLATSRVLLRLSGEHVLTVPPLVVPDLAALPSPEGLARASAVALFVARARTHDPRFALTPANAASVAAICARLDGLPLALELAAARLRVLAPSQMLARLDRRLALLTGGPRDLPPRQRTLRATLDWSFALLDIDERLLLGRLAVFAGGFSLEAAEALAEAFDSASSVLDGLQALTDNHLLQRVTATHAEPRFGMLEVVREYALERLTDAGEAAPTQAAHAAYFLALAERAEPNLDGQDRAAWLDRLEAEQANLEAALNWLLSSDGMIDAARLAGALHGFWRLRGYPSEGRVWLDRIFSHGDADPPDDRLPPRIAARARFAAARLALDQGDFKAARAHLDRCLTVWRRLDELTDNGEARRFLIRSLSLQIQIQGMLGNEINPIEIWEIERLARDLGDPTIEAEVAFNHARGLLHEHGDLDAARAKLLRAQSLVRDHGAAAHLAQQIRIDFGMIALWAGDTAVAREQFTEAMTAARAARDRAFEALALNNLGEASRLAGADVEAAACYEESLRLYHALGARTESPRLLHNLGYLALHGGDLALARTRFAESFAGFRDVAVARGMAEAVAGLAAAAACLGTPEAARAAGRLWGAAAAALAGEGLPIWPADQAEWNRYQPLAQKVLNGADFAAAQTAGRCLSLETAASEAGLP